MVILFTFIINCSFSQSNIRITLQKTYTNEIGVRENPTGSNRGSDIFKYQSAAGVKSGMPWCGSFVFYCYLKSGYRLPIKNPAQSQSYFLDKGRIIVIRGVVKRRPQPGDVIGVSYSNKIGHVGFYDNEDDKYYYTVEGNTRGEKKDPGEGVYRLKRIKRQVTYISNFID